MNLLDLPWIPVWIDGERRLLRPADLATTPADDLAAPRADLTCGLLEFLIGLLQAALRPKDDDACTDLVLDGPPAQLGQKLEALRPALNLRGTGPLFLQEHDLPAEADEVAIERLFLDAAGEFFNKPGTFQALCPACVAAALYVHQTRANQGGRGYRTSLRGGAPLTTLVVPDPNDATGGRLWQMLAQNLVPETQLRALADGPDTPPTIFPWLLPERPDQLTRELIHPLHLYWCMPRRVCLTWTDGPTTCDVCRAATDTSAHAFRRVSAGINYTGPYEHPLSPVLIDKVGTRCLPTPIEGVRYREWLGLVASTRGKDRSTTPARVVHNVLSALGTRRPQTRAFGYAMDSAKPRAWYDRTLPLLDPRGTDLALLQAWLERALEGAGYVRSLVVGHVVAAWTHGKLRGDTTTIANELWERTEGDFFAVVAQAREAVNQGQEKEREVAEIWRRALERHALALFERHVQPELILGNAIERVMKAQNQLQAKLRGAKLKEILGFAPAEKPKTARKSKEKA